MEETKTETEMPLAFIMSEIIRELDHAELKHPNWPTNIFEQVSVITEESGEIAKAANDRDMDELRKELLQTAAMCIRMLKNL